MSFKFIIPAWIKIIVIVTTVGLFLGTIFFNEIKQMSNRKLFYKRSFSSTIIKSNTYYYQSRFREFHLQNGLKIYIDKIKNNNLEVGDLIIKNQNTYNYNLYKKRVDGKYSLFSSYNFMVYE